LSNYAAHFCFLKWVGVATFVSVDCYYVIDKTKKGYFLFFWGGYCTNGSALNWSRHKTGPQN